VADDAPTGNRKPPRVWKARPWKWRAARYLRVTFRSWYSRLPRRITPRKGPDARLTFVTDRVPVFIAQLDERERYVFVNRPYAGYYGRRPKNIVGRHLREVIGEQAYAELQPHVHSVLGEGRDAIWEITEGAKHFQFRATVAREDDGHTHGLLIVGTDITKRKLIEVDLERAKHDAESASRAKDEFLAMLGHELRNPLGVISTAARLLEGLDTQKDGARVREVILRQTAHLARLVDDLLDVGRLMTGKVILHRQPIDLAQCLERSVATFRAMGRTERHVVTVEVRPAWVDADAVRVEQVVANLLGNALKYTPPGGTVRLAVEPVGAEAVLTVGDSGVGILPDLLPRVFDLFVQGNQALDRAHGGLGIGLTLVRRLVELHGGSIEASSPGPEQGTVFTVRFPRISPRPVEAKQPRSGSPGGLVRRVLLVEDNDDARQMTRQLLEVAGHTVFEAQNGFAALEAVGRLQFDVALIDIGLPDLDGYAIARLLRSMPDGKSLLLVALTGYGRPEDRKRSREAGFDAHLVKPFDPDTLTSVLENPKQDGGTRGDRRLDSSPEVHRV
jgi:signal transduction histidine kinase/ActR/RegA family two-component response regulator